MQGESAQRWIVTNGGLGSARTRVTNFFYRWTQSPSCRPPLLLPGSLQGRISPASASPAPKPSREVVRKPPARSPVPHHRAQKRVGGDAPPGVEFVAVVLLLPAQTPAQTRRPGRQRSPLFDRIELEQCFAKVCSAAARRSPPIPFARSPLPNCCYTLPYCVHRGVYPLCVAIRYVTAEWEPAFLRQAREFLFFPLLPREASK